VASALSDPLVLDRMEIEEAGSTNPARLAAAVHSQMPGHAGAVQIYSIAAALDIDEIRRSQTSFEGALLMMPGRNRGAIVVNANASRQRQRFTIAHELGHFLNLSHRPISPDGRFTCGKQDLAGTWSLKNRTQDRHAIQEIEANRFAIELLAPHKLVRPFLSGIPDLARVTDIARHLDLSREACARRYIELKEEPLALVFSQNGVVRYIDRRDTFPFLGLRRGDAMPTLASVPAGSTLSDHEEVDPRDWGMRPNGIDLVAQTMRQEGGYAMTLLALDRQDAEADEDD
jgi:IrrE N-terminal-like domain